MQIHYGDLDSQIVDWTVNNSARDRILSFDLETRVINGNFLNNETILGISVSRRTNRIENDVFVLEEESPQGEIRLLETFDDYLKKVRPLILVGFNHTGYDNVLLSTKMRNSPRILWGLKDSLSRCHMIDVMHTARFVIAEWDKTSPKMLSLAKVIEHPKFSALGLMKNKSLIDGLADKGQKGQQIYEMWKNYSEKFTRYALGDSHDTLLIFEKIFNLGSSE